MSGLCSLMSVIMSSMPDFHSVIRIALLLAPTNHVSLQAALNLNIFAALSGAISSVTRKTKHTNADGSSYETEDNHTVGHAKGAGHANMQAVAQAEAETSDRAYRGIDQGSRKAIKQVDHLGIEGK